MKNFCFSQVLAKSAKLRETQLLAMIRHPYIVTYEDCFIEDGHLYVAMEYAGGGESLLHVPRACGPRTGPSLPRVHRSFARRAQARWSNSRTRARRPRTLRRSRGSLPCACLQWTTCIAGRSCTVT
jgi:hypothetical protein